MGERHVRLALTIGDPGGIGPEICAKLLTGDARREGIDLVLIGAAAALFEEEPSLADHLPLLSGEDAGAGSAAIIDVGGRGGVPARRPTAEGGAVSAKAIETAVSLAKRRVVDGIVTGPISKEALHMAGFPYLGHTEMLAALFDAPDCQMMMVAGGFRVVILTRHLPLRDVAASISRERIVAAVRVTREALEKYFGLENPRIAVASLNPHGSDGGLVGTEERDVIGPALIELRAEGVPIEGPHPADSLFHRYGDRGYDAVIALYHDQGMIPFKMAAFDRGVNVTIGLPVIRTSVCHGTAFDIAGRGKGNARSLEEAVELAACCAVRGRKRSSAV